MYFQQLLFTGEGRATLDRQKRWVKGWNQNGTPTPYRFHSQQEGRGIMFWVGIIGDKLCGPFWVPEAAKLTSNAYTAFLDKHLSPWLDNLLLSLRFKVVLCLTMLHLMLPMRLHHSWNLRLSLEKRLWLGHLVLRP